MTPLVVDPFDENNAISDDGAAMFAVRILPIAEDATTPPTVEELNKAPILGYTEGLVGFGGEGLEAISD